MQDEEGFLRLFLFALRGITWGLVFGFVAILLVHVLGFLV